ncbi:hypothetical protein B0H17DRAFT_1265574 [Mycena rosella]|uniref:Uncharacterized protein n=1 Tax=Mycena rosella TaxID=1033263 RepID=A0AAD7CNZ9_MYCRO|nr:hypothetical protein B0H17DRAFT_1265574 [Mycena rosella]
MAENIKAGDALSVFMMASRTFSYIVASPSYSIRSEQRHQSAENPFLIAISSLAFVTCDESEKATRKPIHLSRFLGVIQRERAKSECRSFKYPIIALGTGVGLRVGSGLHQEHNFLTVESNQAEQFESFSRSVLVLIPGNLNVPGLGAVRQTGTAVTKTAAKNNFEGSDGRVPAVTPVDGRRRVQSWDMINAIREIPEELMGVRGRRKFKQGKGYITKSGNLLAISLAALRPGLHATSDIAIFTDFMRSTKYRVHDMNKTRGKIEDGGMGEGEGGDSTVEPEHNALMILGIWGVAESLKAFMKGLSRFEERLRESACLMR